MERHQIRLKCLELVHRHDRTPAQVLADAAEYEKYVCGTEEERSAAPESPVVKPQIPGAYQGRRVKQN